MSCSDNGCEVTSPTRNIHTGDISPHRARSPGHRPSAARHFLTEDPFRCSFASSRRDDQEHAGRNTPRQRQSRQGEHYRIAQRRSRDPCHRPDQRWYRQASACCSRRRTPIVCFFGIRNLSITCIIHGYASARAPPSSPPSTPPTSWRNISQLSPAKNGVVARSLRSWYVP